MRMDGKVRVCGYIFGRWDCGYLRDKRDLRNVVSVLASKPYALGYRFIDKGRSFEVLRRQTLSHPARSFIGEVMRHENFDFLQRHLLGLSHDTTGHTRRNKVDTIIIVAAVCLILPFIIAIAVKRRNANIRRRRQEPRCGTFLQRRSTLDTHRQPSQPSRVRRHLHWDKHHPTTKI